MPGPSICVNCGGYFSTSLKCRCSRIVYLECRYPTKPHSLEVPSDKVLELKAYLERHGADCEWAFVEKTNLPVTHRAESTEHLWNPIPITK